jgi:CO dehydrogenase/acetyl-CoA synthase alpha subunit
MGLVTFGAPTSNCAREFAAARVGAIFLNDTMSLQQVAPYILQRKIIDLMVQIHVAGRPPRN